jgi:tetratricopeptide (TPR) repeat protein
LRRDNPKAASYRLDLARNYERRGEWLRAKGRGPEADKNLELALALRRELARDFPERGQHGAWLAVSYRTLGEAQNARNQPKEAEKTLLQALDLQEKLAADFPALPTHQDELARTQLALAAVLRKLNRSQEAQAAYRQALSAFEQLAVAFPRVARYQTQLFQTAQELGRLLEAGGQPQKKKEVLDAAFAVFEKLTVQSAKTPEDLAAMAANYQNLANLLRGSGQSQEAEKAYQKGLELFRRRADKFPAVAAYRAELGQQCRRFADWLQIPEKDKERAQALKEAIKVFESLAADFPDVPQHRYWAASSNEWLGGILVGLKDPKQGEEHFRKAIELLGGLPTDFLAHVDGRVAADNAFSGLVNLLQSSNRQQEVERVLRQAIDFYEKVIAAFPDALAYRMDLARNHNRLGSHFRNAGRTLEARDELQKAKEYWRASSQTELAPFKKAADADPENGLRWGELAVACYRFGNWEASLDIFKTKAHLGNGVSGSAWQWFYIAMAHGQLDHQEEARQWYYRSLDWVATAKEKRLRGVQAEAAAVLGLPDPGDRAQHAFELGEEGATYERQGQPEKAKESRSKAIELYAKLAADFPAVPGYSATLLDLLYKTGRQQDAEKVYDKMLVARTKAIELDANNPSRWLERGWAFHNASQYDKAIADATKCIELDAKNPSPWILRGWSFHNSRHYDKAIADLTKAIELEPKSAVGWHVRAASHGELRQYDQAIADFSKAIELEPGTMWHRYERAGIYRALRQYDKAIADYSKVAELEPKNAWPRRRLADTHRELAQELSRDRNQLNQAEAQHRQALKLFENLAADFPKEPQYSEECGHSQRFLGWLLIESGRLPEAETAFRSAAAIFEKLCAGPSVTPFRRQMLADTYRNLGNVVRANSPAGEFGRLEEIRALWEKVLEGQPTDHDSWFGYAELCLFLNKEDAYRRNRTALLTRFGNTTDPVIAERTARACLLLPVAGEELQQAAALADRAVTLGEKHAFYGFFMAAKALADYRRDRFESAIDWGQKAGARGVWIPTYLVLAMAHQRLGHTGQARQSLAEAVKTYDWKNVPWSGIIRPLRREAEALLQQESGVKAPESEKKAK